MRIWPSVIVALLMHGLLFALPSPARKAEQPRLEEVRFVLLPPAASVSASKSQPEADPVPEPEPEPLPKPKIKPKPKPEAVPEPKPAESEPVEPKSPKPEPAQSFPQSVEAAPPVARPPAPSGQAGPVQTAFGGPEGPRFRERVMPEYPLRARRMNREGVVILELHINAEGQLTDATVLEKAGHGMDEAALQAIRRSTFFPARQDGSPVASRARLSIRFQLRE